MRKKSQFPSGSYINKAGESAPVEAAAPVVEEQAPAAEPKKKAKKEEAAPVAEEQAPAAAEESGAEEPVAEEPAAAEESAPF